MRDYSDKDVERLLREKAMAKGFNAWLDFELIAAGNGKIEIELTTNANMLQHHGFVHGGVVGALADTACSWAAATLAGDVVTASYTIQLLAPALPPTLTVTAEVIKRTKRSASVEAKVYCKNEAGEPRLVANALSSIAILA